MEMRGRARMCAYSRRTRCAEETETSDRTSAREILERGERCSLLSFIVALYAACAAGPRARAAPLSRRGAPPRDEVMCVDRPIRHVADAFLIDDVIDREIDRTPRVLGPRSVVFGSRGWLLYYELRGRDAPRMCAPCMGNTCP